MSAEIITLNSKDRLDAAWTALSDHRARILTDPKCLLDRTFVEEDAKLEERFKRLYLRSCG